MLGDEGVDSVDRVTEGSCVANVLPGEGGQTGCEGESQPRSAMASNAFADAHRGPIVPI